MKIIQFSLIISLLLSSIEAQGNDDATTTLYEPCKGDDDCDTSDFNLQQTCANIYVDGTKWT